MIIEKKQEEVKNNTVPTAPMPSKHSISAARSSHSTIYTQLRLVDTALSFKIKVET